MAHGDIHRAGARMPDERLAIDAGVDFDLAQIRFAEDRTEGALGRDPAQEEALALRGKPEALEVLPLVFAQEILGRHRVDHREADGMLDIAVTQDERLQVHAFSRLPRSNARPSAIEMRGA